MFAFELDALLYNHKINSRSLRIHETIKNDLRHFGGGSDK